MQDLSSQPEKRTPKNYQIPPKNYQKAPKICHLIELTPKK